MLHLGHNVVGVLRLNSCPAVRFAPATRRTTTTTTSGGAASFSSSSASLSPAEREEEEEKKKMMDESKKTKEEDQVQHKKKDTAETKDHGNIMGHSFGEGYATRSDEEGFGGIYGGNQTIDNPNPSSDVSHPDYDKTQGSEVAGKEKSRNQPH